MLRKSLAVAAVLALAAPMPALAHDSFAMFEHTKQMELKNATVVEWQWTSPHTWLYVLVPNAKGQAEKYSIEGGNPGALRRDGFGKGTLSPGDKVTVYMSPLRSGEKGGAMNAVVLPNSKMLGTRMSPT